MEIINYSGKKSYRTTVARNTVFRREPNRSRYATSAVVSSRNYGMKNFLMTLREASFLFLKGLLRIVEFGWIIPALYACIYFPKKAVDDYAYKNGFVTELDVPENSEWILKNLDDSMKNLTEEQYVVSDIFDFLLKDPDELTLPEVKLLKVSYRNVTYNQSRNIGGFKKFLSNYGLKNMSTLISCNGLTDVSLIPSRLKVPSIDGIIYKVTKNDTVSSIASRYRTTANSILDANDLQTSDLTVGQEIFVPGGYLPNSVIEKFQGEHMVNPLKARYVLTSKFGYRVDPISGKKNSYHTGIDMACPTGTKIYAAMSGTVEVAGWHNSYGNYVIIKHKDHYQTLYGHMSKILTKKKKKINQGDVVGLVGTTGYSTGPHLHFTVYKNGNLVDPLSLLK